MMRLVKRVARQLGYVSGLFGALHRIRNRRTLTVFMFHRVLPRDSVAFARAEKEFTFSVDGFGVCLDFLSRHYQLISLADVRNALSGGPPLPDCAGLVTFDDGWRDTLAHALPELARRRIPGVLFLTTEVTELSANRWWQDALVERLTQASQPERIAKALDLPPGTSLSQLTAALAQTPVERRQALVSDHAANELLERQMLSSSELAGLAPWIMIAGHGHSHAPLIDASMATAELSACAAYLKGHGAETDCMSFPHGVVRPEVLPVAAAAGFGLCFTSEPHLNRLPFQPSQPPRLLGRIHIPENEWTMESGRISPARLANFLFWRPQF